MKKSRLLILTLILALCLALCACETETEPTKAVTEEPAAMVEEPAVEEPAAEEAVVEEAVAEEPVAEEPTAEEAAVEEAAAEEAAVEEPVAEEAAVEEPAAEEAAVEEAAAEEPVVEEPAAEEPVVEEPVVEEPVAEEAVAEEAVVEEPAAEEPAAEEPAAEEPAAEEAAVEEPAAEEPAVADDVVVLVNGTNAATVDSFVETTSFNRIQYIAYYDQMVNTYSMYGIPVDDLNAQFEYMLGEDGKQEFAEISIDQLAYNEMLKLECESQGISFTKRDIINKMKEMFGYEDPADEPETMMGVSSSSVTVPMVDSDLDAVFYNYLETGVATAYENLVSVKFFEDYALAALQEDALFNKALEDRVFEEEQVSARHILVEDEDLAKELLERINSGEEWNAIAEEYSIDKSNASKGGDLGWFGHGVMVEEFESAAFALEPGTITSEPVKTQFGYHLIACDGKEVRSLEGDALANAQDAFYNEWNAELRSRYTVEVFDNWQDSYPTEPEFVPVATEAPEEEAVEEPVEVVVEEAAEEAAAEEPAAEPVEEPTAEEPAAEETEEELVIDNNAEDSKAN